MKLGVILIAGLTALSACSNPAGVDARDAAVWISPDGNDWERVCHPSLGGSGEQQMLGLAFSGDRLVAVGTEIVDGERDAVVWLSEDGREWRRSTSVDLAGSGEQWLTDVAFTDFGWIAVGSAGRTRDLDAAIWVSDDGAAWTRAKSIPSFQGTGLQSANTVTQSGSVVFAGGRDVNDGALWRSDDGSTWEPVDAAAFGGDGLQNVLDLAVDGPGLWAAGEHDNDAAVWFLGDAGWVEIEAPGAFGGFGVQRVESVAVGHQTVVAVGEQFDYDRVFLGGGSEGTQDGAAWKMDAEENWHRVGGSDAFEGVGEQAMVSVISWQQGFVAVGFDLAGRGSVVEGIAEFGSGLDVDAEVWLSADGDDWLRVSHPSFGGEDWQDMFDVVEVPDVGLVAVGGDDFATACG